MRNGGASAGVVAWYWLMSAKERNRWRDGETPARSTEEQAAVVGN